MKKYIIIAVLIFVLFPYFCNAEEIEISVHTHAEPKSALGIFFASGKVVQQPNTSFERIDDDLILVRMPYELKNLPSASSFATAYVLTADNEIVFGDVRLVSAADDGDSFWRLPLCKPDKTQTATQMPMAEQFNYLDRLLQVRLKKRQEAQKTLSEKLSPELLSRLQKLEKGFGMHYEQALSTESPALELVERLTRIKNTILLYRSSKSLQTTP